MTLKKKLDKHYKREEKKQKIKIKLEINRVLFWNKVKKVLFGM